MPTVMLSSTFYDLRQVRKDLQEFIVDQLGYGCLVSESPSFPVDPDLDTITNCRRRVEENADLLVLIVGSRYGYIDQASDKSVTNLEYLAARSKAIPIYVLVQRQVLDTLAFYERNPAADFGEYVDTTRLYDFVSGIRNDERAWTFAFDTAQDIVNTLRAQLGHLIDRLLNLRLATAGGGLPAFLRDAGPEVIRMALEKPKAWEYRLFLQRWCDRVQASRPLLRQYQAGISIGVAEWVPAESAANWLGTRLHELQQQTEAANVLLNECAEEAYGPPGQPGDEEHIVWVADELARVIAEVLAWALRVRRARVEAPFTRVAQVLSTAADQIIRESSTFPQNALRELDLALAEPPTDPPRELTLTLRFEFSNQEELNAALDEASAVWNA